MFKTLLTSCMLVFSSTAKTCQNIVFASINIIAFLLSVTAVVLLASLTCGLHSRLEQSASEREAVGTSVSTSKVMSTLSRLNLHLFLSVSALCLV